MIFHESDTFEQMFYKYLEDIAITGPLFSNEDEFLDDDDYYCLLRIITSHTQRYPNYRTFRDRNQNSAFLKSFHRCFGIYLREATLRYATSMNEDGLWNPLTEGVEQDFRHLNIYNNFWETGSRDIRQVLTGNTDAANGRPFFYAIFNAFGSNDVKYSKPIGEDNEYCKHLLKLAILPRRYNPVAGKFNDVLTAFRTNSVDRYLEDLDRRTLQIHELTRSHLATRILSFFRFVDEAKRDHIPKEEAQNSRYNYFNEWLELAYAENISNDQQREYAEDIQKSAQVVFRLILGNKKEFNYNIPPIQSIKALFPDIPNLRNTSSINISTGEDSFSIDDGIADFGSFTTIQKNQLIENLIANQTINVTFNGDEYELPNPWYTKNQWHMLGNDGQRKNSWPCNEDFYLVTPESWKQPVSCEAVKDDGAPVSANIPSLNKTVSDNSGKNVFTLQSAPNLKEFNCIRIKFENGNEVKIEIENPDQIHLCHNFEGNPIFISQKSQHKIAIKTIEFSHLGEISTNDCSEIKRLFNNDVNVNITPSNRLVITNNSNDILTSEKTVIKNKIIPAITLLPQNTDVWVTKENDLIHGYISTPAANLSNDWTATTTPAVREFTLNANATDSICDIHFVGGGGKFNLITPYYKPLKDKRLGSTLKSRDIWRNTNACDNIIPANASYYFKWQENGVVFEIEVPLSKKVNIYHCYKFLDINGAKTTFGWKYKNTAFVIDFEQDSNYKGPKEARPERVYTCTDQERTNYLDDLINEKAHLKKERSEAPKRNTGNPFAFTKKKQSSKPNEGTQEDNFDPAETFEYMFSFPDAINKCEDFCRPYAPKWILYHVPYTIKLNEIKPDIKNAYQKGWGAFPFLFSAHLLEIDSTSTAELLGRVMACWKTRFRDNLVSKIKASDISNEIKDFFEKVPVISMENVDIVELMQFYQMEDFNNFNQRVSDAVDNFIPKLTGETLDFIQKLHIDPNYKRPNTQEQEEL